MKRIVLVSICVLAVIGLSACAAGPNAAMNIPSSGGDIAGFWLGLWHGMIAAITFIISLFTDSVSVYEVHNSGALYDLGFVLGTGILFGGGSTVSIK